MATFKYDNIYHAIKDPVISFRLDKLKGEKRLMTALSMESQRLSRELGMEFLAYDESDKRKFLALLLLLVDRFYAVFEDKIMTSLRRLSKEASSEFYKILDGAIEPLGLGLTKPPADVTNGLPDRAVSGYSLNASLALLIARQKSELKAAVNQLRDGTILPTEAAKTVSTSYKIYSRYLQIIAAKHITNIFNNAISDISMYNQDIYGVLRFSAILDSRTSEICLKLNGTLWDVVADRGRIPYPPLHPHCRSQMIPMFTAPLSAMSSEQRNYIRQIQDTETLAQWKKRTNYRQ